MKVLLFGMVDEGPGFPRIRALVKSLELLGARVERLLVPPPGQGNRAGLLSHPFQGARALFRFFRGRRELLRLGRALPPPDLVLVGYPAHGAADLAGRIWPGVPVVVDLFLSLYDTVIRDRGLWPDGGAGAALLRFLDGKTCRSGRLVLLDTEEMCSYMAEETGLPRERFVSIPCGDPDAPERPEPYRGPREGEPLRLFFAGTGPPLQGVEVLLEALDRVRAPVVLTLAGGGKAARRAARRQAGKKVRFLEGWLDRSDLAGELRRCHLSLGIFGNTEKADRVVPLKVYHGLAEGRPVLTGDSRAVRRLLVPGEEVLLCPRGNPQALAKKIEEIQEDPGDLESLARRGARAFRERFSLPALAKRWKVVLERLGLEGRGRPGEDLTSGAVRPREPLEVGP